LNPEITEEPEHKNYTQV